jgi:pimeloyl-ACP methyl ester carboxylesterase
MSEDQFPDPADTSSEGAAAVTADTSPEEATAATAATSSEEATAVTTDTSSEEATAADGDASQEDSTTPTKRKRRKWPWVVPLTIVMVLFLAWVGLNSYGAYWVAHGGYIGQKEPSASSLGFPATNVSYGKNLVAWYSPPTGSNPVAVIVHGYQANRAHVLGTAVALAGKGYGLMIPDLGYVSGKSDFGGGDREANEVRQAVDYVHAHTSAPVVLIGYSEGGAESILAAQRGAAVDAVVSDSAPVSFVSIASNRVGMSQDFFAVSSIVYPWFSGGGHLEDLSSVLPGHYHVPTLIIQGTADTTVPYADGPTLAGLTHGQLWTVRGVGHDQAMAADPTAYIARVTSFINAAVAAHR